MTAWIASAQSADCNDSAREMGPRISYRKRFRRLFFSRASHVDNTPRQSFDICIYGHWDRLFGTTDRPPTDHRQTYLKHSNPTPGIPCRTSGSARKYPHRHRIYGCNRPFTRILTIPMYLTTNLGVSPPCLYGLFIYYRLVGFWQATFIASAGR